MKKFITIEMKKFITIEKNLLPIIVIIIVIANNPTL